MICDTCNKINRTCLPENKEEKIIKEFCKLIPKDPTEDIGNFEDDDFIYAFGKNSDFLNPIKAPENYDLNVNELQGALKTEMKIMQYLMKKHKNRRAASFAQKILYPTIEKLNKILEKQLEESKVDVVNDNKFEQNQKGGADTFTKDNKEQQRQQGIKQYCNKIAKEHTAFYTQKGNLISELGNICKREDGRNNYFVQTLNNAHEIIDELVNNRRHTRFLRFSEIFDAVVDNTIKNVNSACSIKKGNQTIINK